MPSSRQDSMAYQHSHVSMLDHHDFMSDLHGLPLAPKTQPYWSMIEDSQAASNLHRFGDSSSSLGHFSMPATVPNLNVQPVPSNGFGEPTNFGASGAFNSTLESQIFCSPKTVTPSQLYGAVPTDPNRAPPRLLGEPFTPVKNEMWGLPSSSSPAEQWSSPDYKLPSSHESPESPSPTPRRRPRTRSRPDQLPTPPLSSASSTSTVVGSRTAQRARQRYPGTTIREVPGARLVCTDMKLNGERCDKKFVRQEHLTRHKKSGDHSIRRPFECPACHKAFDRSDNCNMHLIRHFHLSAKSRTKPPHIRCEEDAAKAGCLTEYREFVWRESGGLHGTARGAGAGKRPRRLRSTPAGGDGRWALAAAAAGSLPSDSREALRRMRKQGQRLKMEDAA